MARHIRHDESRPAFFDAEDIEAHGGDIAICRCGLSAERPFCDGSHRAAEDEAEDAVYKYEGDDPGGPRREVVGFVYADEADEGDEAGAGAGADADGTGGTDSPRATDPGTRTDRE